MTNSARLKGRDFEALIRRWLTDRGQPNMNPATIGRPGGDIILRHHPILIEAKCRRETALSTWIKQAEKDAGDNLLAVLVHKRKGVADPAKQWVTLDLGSFATILAACDPVKLSESVAERQKRHATATEPEPAHDRTSESSESFTDDLETILAVVEAAIEASKQARQA